MSDMKMFTLAPPLQQRNEHKQRNAKSACGYHEGVQHHIAAGESVDSMRDRVIHWARALFA
jgi:hypothetical protein